MKLILFLNMVFLKELMKHWTYLWFEHKRGIKSLEFIIFKWMFLDALFLSAGSDYEFVAILHLKYSVCLKWYSILILNIT